MMLPYLKLFHADSLRHAYRDDLVSALLWSPVSCHTCRVLILKCLCLELQQFVNEVILSKKNESAF